MNASIQQLTQKEMTRKEFLITLVLAVVSIFGFGHVVEMITGRSIHKNLASPAVSSNKGSYGL
jgi:predicted CDP-diglyceride synthetase/phosphatidate cytidylyltransferase